MNRLQPTSACAAAEIDDLARRFASFDADALVASLYDIVFEDLQSLAASPAQARCLSRIVSVTGAVNIYLALRGGIPDGDIGRLVRFGDEVCLTADRLSRQNETL